VTVRRLAWLATAAGAFVALWIGWGVYVIVTTARPPYEVSSRLSDGVEIRRYEEQTWISAAPGADNASFRVLASYMSFILPQGMTPESAPAPAGQAIDFDIVPARRVAALRFSWWTTESRVEAKMAVLQRTLQEHGIETTGRPFLMRYNDPWTPPFLRRNEVAVEVR
jgi:hypothetical protein